MAGIQFLGRNDVVSAFKSRSIDVWGIFEKKNFITAGEGAESLNEFLKKLEPGGSGTLYTLKVFKNVDDPDEITDRTECNGSFGFKLTGSLGTVSGNGNDAVLARLDAIDKRLNGEEDEDEGETFEDIFKGWMKEPAKLATVIGAVQSLLGGNAAPMMQAIGSIQEPAPETKKEIAAVMPNSNDMLERLSAAIDRLERVDPKIVLHLEKLATLGETNPGLFKVLISQLDAL
jgi:hypothetical protein